MYSGPKARTAHHLYINPSTQKEESRHSDLGEWHDERLLRQIGKFTRSTNNTRWFYEGLVSMNQQLSEDDKTNDTDPNVQQIVEGLQQL